MKIELFRKATAKETGFVDTVFKSSCDYVYNPVLRCSVSRRISRIAANFERGLIYLIFLGLLLFAGSPIWANSTYPLDTVQKEAQFNHLLKDLRCLVCQNQDLADSNAELAKDLRNQVYQMVKEGKSDSEISDYLTARYGDFILFKPPVKEVTLLLWFGPILFLLLGFVIFWRTCFRVREKGHA